MFAIIIVTSLMIPTMQLNTDQPSQKPFDVENYVAAWVKIWNTYDLDQVDVLFLRNDRLSYFSSEKEGVIVGIDAVREHHKGFGFVPGGKESPNELWVEDLHTSSFDSTAVVTGIWFFKRADGTVQRGPVTIVYVAHESSYKIAHMNFSNYEEK